MQHRSCVLSLLGAKVP